MIVCTKAGKKSKKPRSNNKMASSPVLEVRAKWEMKNRGKNSHNNSNETIDRWTNGIIRSFVVCESVWVRRAEPLQLLSSHLLIMVVFFRKTRMTRNTLDTYLKQSEQRTSTHYTANHFNYGILIGSRHYNLCSFSLMLIKMRVIHLRKISIEQEKKKDRETTTARKLFDLFKLAL